MLRSESRSQNYAGIGLALAVGAAAAWLVSLGNPGNMGICGACFLRDLAGAVGIAQGPAIFRPEVAGAVLGALALALARGRFTARSGSHAVARFLLGVVMAMAALVFLGCPFRMLQRLGGGDLNAWIALPGFVAGVGLGLLFERRGYIVGKTAAVPAPVGLLGPLAIAALLAAFLAGGALRGPGPGDAGKPAHAPWEASLAIALGVGAALSATGFCAITAARRVFLPGRAMLLAVAVFVLGYAAVSAASGNFALSTTAPIAHSDVLWNALALALLGLAGALAGGCPVRQLVMTGEGNGDAFVTVAGLVVGGALAHAWGLVSAAASPTADGGPTDAGKAAVLVGLVLAAVYGFLVSRFHPAAPAATPTGSRT
jgi:YedE family putative selenium metabolism protein